jgi:hypothetical protein
MDVPESVKSIKPAQWAMIAGAGIGLGLLLRLRAKSKAATTTATTTDTPFTGASTQQYGDYSGTGQTGYFQGGAATVDPNAASNIGTAIVPVIPLSSTTSLVTVPGPEQISTIPPQAPAAAPPPTQVAEPIPAPAAAPAATPIQHPIMNQGMYQGSLAMPAEFAAYLANGGLVTGKDDVGLSSNAQIKADVLNRVRLGELPQSSANIILPVLG